MQKGINHNCRASTRVRQISVAGLIAAYAEAAREASDLWERVAEIENEFFDLLTVSVRVQYSWMVRGWIDDETGERAQTPLYAYSEEQIVEVCEKDREFRLGMLGKGDATGRQKVLDACAARIEKLTTEYRELERAMDKLEHDCGLKAAELTAGAASDRRSAIGEELCYRVPATLHEAALMAHWVTGASLNDDCDLLYSVLANIARAGGLAAGPPDMRVA